MAGAGMKGYNVLLTGDKKSWKMTQMKQKKKGFMIWRYSKRYTKMSWYPHKNTRPVSIFLKNPKPKAINYGYARQEWMKLSGKFDPTTGYSNTRLHKKSTKWKIYEVTRNPKKWTTKLKLIRLYLQKLDVQICG